MTDDFNKYENLFHLVDFGILVLDPKGIILDVNACAVNLLGMRKKNRSDLISYFESLQLFHQDGTPYKQGTHPLYKALKNGSTIKDITTGIILPKTSNLSWINISIIPEFRNDEKKPFRVFITLKEITELKNTHELQVHFERAVESATDAIGISTPEGEHYYQNRAFDELFGDIGKNPSDSLFVDKRVEHEVFKTVTSGKEWNGEVKMYGKRKKVLDILLKAYPIKDHEGKIKGLVGVHTDRTFQKHQQDALVNSEAQLQKSVEELEHIINALPGMVSVVDRDFNVLLANKEVIEDFGQSKKEEVFGKKCYSVRQGRDTICPGCGIDKAYQTGKATITFSTPEEEEITGRATKAFAVPLKDKKGAVWGAVETIMDITDIRNAENEIREKEERFKSFVDQAADAIYVSDMKGQIVEANPQAMKQTGYSREKLLNMKVMELDMNFPTLKQCLAIWSTLEIGKSIQIEGRHIRKDGTSFPVEINSSVIEIKGKKHILGFVRDVTDRKEAEEKLLMSEDRFRTLFNHISEAVLIHTIDGSFVEVNEEACKRYGYTKEEFHKISPKDLDSPEHSKLVKHRSAELLKTGRLSFETIHLTKDGKEIPVEINSSVVQFKDETCALSVCRDITERKKAEEKLRNSEKRFRSLIEHSKDSIILIDRNGTVLYESPSTPVLTGYSVNERIGKNGFENIHPEDVDRIKKLFINIAKKPGSTINSQFRAVRKDGSVWWAIATVTNLYNDPNVNAIVVNYHDDTERKSAELALKKSEVRLSNAMKMAKIGYWEYDVLKDEFTFNDHFYNVFRTSADKVGGYTMRSAKYAELFVHPDDQILVGIEIKNAIEATDPNLVRYVEHRIIYADGEIGHIAVQFTIIKDKDGRTIATRGANQDITQLKKVEEELKRQNEEYQSLNEEYLAQNEVLAKNVKRIQKINDELKLAMKKAEESDKLKSAFLANMSHEIRTPMNGILGFAELLNDPDLTEEEQENYLHVIKESGDRMVKIIDDIIDISKIDAGQVELNIENTNINRLIDSFQAFFLPEAEEKGLSLISSKGLPESECVIKTDELKLGQILANLIKNAIKFTENGKIKFGYQLKKNKLEFHVMDTGRGVKKENQEIIFERFRKEVISETNTVDGSGLGLSISKAFTEQLGGKIWLESKIGKGSVFYFTVPYTSAKQKRKAKNTLKKKVQSSQQKIKVLIAEDDAASSSFLRELMKKNGIEYVLAKDGKEALDIALTDMEIDLILMDIKMPEMDGLSVTKHVKKLRPKLPVIAQTSYHTPLDRQRAIEAGCDNLISKPIDKNLLIDIINENLILQ